MFPGGSVSSLTVGPAMPSSCRSAATVVRTLVCAAFGAFVLWVSDGRDAAASCGDWLEGHQLEGHQLGGQTAAMPDIHGRAALSAATGRAPADRLSAGAPTTDATSRHTPCRGPACRKAPVKPLLPIDGGVIRLDLDRFAWLVGLESPAVAGRGHSIVTVNVAPFSTDAAPPERPPQAV